MRNPEKEKDLYARFGKTETAGADWKTVRADRMAIENHQNRDGPQNVQ